MPRQRQMSWWRPSRRRTSWQMPRRRQTSWWTPRRSRQPRRKQMPWRIQDLTGTKEEAGKLAHIKYEADAK